MEGFAPDAAETDPPNEDAVDPAKALASAPPPTTPPASGWIPPEAAPWPSPRTRRVLEAMVWIVSALLLAVAGWVNANGREAPTSAWRIGYVAGTVAGALALATVIRWVWLRLRRRRLPQARLVSTWIPIVGVFFAAALLGAILSQAVAPPAPVDPDTMFHVGSGYVLTATDPDLEQEIRSEFNDMAVQPRDMAVTSIEADDGSTGLLVVMDMRVIELAADLTLQAMIIGAGDDIGRDAT